MAGFKYAKGPKDVWRFPIASATTIVEGSAVTLTTGVGVVNYDASDFDDPILGFAAEASANGETEIAVYCNPETIFKLETRKVYTATGGSTTTFVDDSLVPTTNDMWIGGYLEVVTCAADASQVGKMIPITDSTGGGGTLTFATQPAAFAAGDTAILHMGKLGIGEFGWDLVAADDDIDYDTSVGTGLVLVDADPANKITYWKIRQHLLAGHALAIG